MLTAKALQRIDKLEQILQKKRNQEMYQGKLYMQVLMKLYLLIAPNNSLIFDDTLKQQIKEQLSINQEIQLLKASTSVDPILQVTDEIIKLFDFEYEIISSPDGISITERSGNAYSKRKTFQEILDRCTLVLLVLCITIAFSMMLMFCPATIVLLPVMFIGVYTLAAIGLARYIGLRKLGVYFNKKNVQEYVNLSALNNALKDTNQNNDKWSNLVTALNNFLPKSNQIKEDAVADGPTGILSDGEKNTSEQPSQIQMTDLSQKRLR